MLLYEGFIKHHFDKVDVAQEKLFAAQLELIETYRAQWAEMNYLIENGLWNEKAVYLANAYGMKVGEEMYVFQLDGPLPFLPNPYYLRFRKSKEEFVAAKLLINLQLRDVIDQLGPEAMREPAALIIKHYYSDVRLFDMDNKAKQVLINTFREKLLKDDNVRALSFYSEEAIQSGENRTMIYLCPVSKRIFMEAEIASHDSRIDHLPGVIVGKYPQNYFPQSPLDEDSEGKLKEDNTKEDRLTPDEIDRLNQNFM